MTLYRCFLIILISVFSSISFAQFTDDFSDGDFTNNPTWTGDDAYFIVNPAFQLQLNSIAGQDSTFLVTSSSSVDDTQWEFWVRMSFTTSNNNHVKVYLVADNDSLDNPLNGYYVRIGNNAPAPKTANLFRQDGNTHTEILTGITEVGAASNNIVRVKVIRDNAGNWELFCDATGGFGYIPQGTTNDNTYTSGDYFGVLCKYTSGNVARFFFDDFYVGPIIIDSVPPSLSSVQVISNNELNVFFDESVEPNTAENTTNYFVNNGIGGPNAAVRDVLDATLVRLTFTNTFSLDQINTLTVSNVEDFSGNAMSSENIDFVFTEQAFGDVVISEIMADPTPVVGLPDHEYIELYNNTAFPVDISNWTIRHGSTNRIIPSGVIQPDSFLILCTTAAFPDLQGFGNVVAVPSLSATALTNSGTLLTLLNDDNEIIHFVNYSDTWYQDNQKAGGGWSLEMIDLNFPCSQSNNWRASNDPSGGTPGRRNSINAANPDNTAPSILAVCQSSSNTLEITFNEPLAENTINQISFYTVNNSIGNPNSVSFDSPLNQVITLVFDSNFVDETVYELNLSQDIADCAGNNIGNNNIAVFSTFGAEPYDLVINEIMPNATPVVGLPPVEYFELYNRKDYPISLQNWQVRVGNTSRVFPCVTVAAKDYLIVSHANSADQMKIFGNVAGVENFPSLTNSGTTITVFNEGGNTISSVSYETSWYKSNTKSNGGWSLEQIDPNNPCGGFDNWMASSNNLGGTPGKLNAVNASNPDNVAPRLLRVGVNSPSSLTLHFDESLSPINLSDISLYEIDNGVGQPAVALVNEPQNSSVNLILNQVLQDDIVYEITVSTDIVDCVGNNVKIESSKAKFALPKEVLSNDIIVNEILFNQLEGGATFVELYNRSNKILDLKNLRVSRIDTIANELLQINVIQEESYLIFPQDYVVLTVNPRAVQQQYNRPNRDNFIRMGGMPTFNNSGGTVVISQPNLEVIDAFYYLQDMHFPLLNSFRGVSLERLDYDRPSQRRDNWHSAAANVGYATPGYKNSQFTAAGGGEGPVSVDPKIFSPDQDGHQDILNINYEFDEPGYVATVSIYDPVGRMVRLLVQTELLGTNKGTFTWDGINDMGEKCRVGIYVIYFEVFDTKGNVKKYKKSAVLANKWQ